MNLRLPIVAGLVVIAGAAAAVRALRPPAPAAGIPLAGFVASTAASREARERSSRERIAESRRPLVVYVAGEVARSGVYTLPAGTRAVDALHAAGGPAATADLVAVNLAEPLVDGEEVAVPAKGTAAARPRLRNDAASSGHRKRHKKVRHASDPRRQPGRRAGDIATSDASGEPPGDIVDLNAAGESELETLPGVGASLAGRIVTVRDQSGPFGSLDDLLDVAGMTQSKLDAIEPYVTLR